MRIAQIVAIAILFVIPFGDSCAEGSTIPPVSRIAFFGNSITAHDPAREELGWFWYHGMAASQPDKDYVHRVQLELAAETGQIPEVEIISADVNRKFDSSDVDGRSLDMDIHVTAFAPQLVIVVMGDNAGDAPYSQWLSVYQQIVIWTPDARRIAVGTWGAKSSDDPKEANLMRAAAETGMTYVQIFDLHTPATEANEFAHGGVRWHPNNLGMQLIADRIVESISVSASKTLMGSNFFPIVHTPD